MTISYNYDVSRNSWTTTIKLLCRWRGFIFFNLTWSQILCNWGSVWKSVWAEVIIWLIGYYIVFFIYRSEWLLTPDGQRLVDTLFTLNYYFWRFFEKLVDHISHRIEYIPLNFLLGELFLLFPSHSFLLNRFLCLDGCWSMETNIQQSRIHWEVSNLTLR